MAMDISNFLTKNGTIDTNKIKSISDEDAKTITEQTSFLQLDPTLAQRIKTIVYYGEQVHPTCTCGKLLKYSPKGGKAFKDFCGISCAKKHHGTNVEQFKNTLQENRNKIESEYENAVILSVEETKQFFIDNIELFKNGGGKVISLLNNNLNYKKSLYHYTTEKRLNGRIYELIHGKGKCNVCGEPTSFLSLDKGYTNHCSVHGQRLGSKNRGLNSITAAMEHIKTFENYSEFEIIHVPDKINDAIILRHHKCQEEFEVNLKNGKINSYFLRCGVCGNKSVSNPEMEIRQWLKNNNIDFIPQYKIGNKRIDIVIPSFNLAIEYNGILNHSYGKSKYARFDNWEYRDENIHLNRLILCNEQGLDLIQINENEWRDKTKKEIWLSILSTKTNLTQKIYARKCVVKTITDNKIIKDFLEMNHLQGYCSSNIKLGLYHNEELVSVMTFGKPRFNKRYQWELARFCNKLNMNVVGGASKLFKHFIRNYNPENIISYCDRRMFIGDLYEKLDFQLLYNSDPNYVYTKNGKILSRYQCQKHKLKNILGENYDETKTEINNMIDNEYRILWDCGNSVYLWGK